MSLFCPTPQCDKTKPDKPGSLSWQSSLPENKDKIKWQLVNINGANQQGWTGNSWSHLQVLKSVPKSPNSSHHFPLKNSTMRMNLYFRNKLLRCLEIKEEEETLKHHRILRHLSSPHQGPSWCQAYHRCSINVCGIDDVKSSVLKSASEQECAWKQADLLRHHRHWK